MRDIRSSMAAFLVLSLTGPALGSERARAVTPARCQALRVTSWDGANRSRSFSATDTDDLRIDVGLEGKHTNSAVEIKLFTPRGKLYQVLPARTALDDGNGRAFRRQSRRRLRVSSARLPVAGTHITTFAIFGEWRAEAYLDGEEEPCAPPLEFRIEP